ncbi:MAG: hypothetical protein FJ279_32560, partial [Planctomycetes bacterium]|nr:hypothetical protein [Planctomycetota bacterium]
MANARKLLGGSPLRGYRRVRRLKLEELEPRLAPSSLLHNLPVLGAWGMDGVSAQPDPEIRIQDSDFADPGTESPAHRSSPVCPVSSEFAPVLPPELTPIRPRARTPIRADADGIQPATGGSEVRGQYSGVAQTDTLFALLAEPPEADGQGKSLYPGAGVPGRWGRAPDIAEGGPDLRPRALDDSGSHGSDGDTVSTGDSDSATDESEAEVVVIELVSA